MRRLRDAFQVPMVAGFAVVAGMTGRLALAEMPSRVTSILKARCYSCHGADGKDSGGIGSMLDTGNLVDHGWVVPGSEESPLLQAIVTCEMPLGGSPLPVSEIEAIRQWIRSMPPPRPPRAGDSAGAAKQALEPAVRIAVPTLSANPSVLQYHGDAARTGHYVEPAFRPDASGSLHLSSLFKAKIDGAVYAQPVFVSRGGPNHRDVLIVATEKNKVYGLDASTGEKLWERSLGNPAPRSELPCGNIDPLGVTGTPVVDGPSNTVILDAMSAPPGGQKQHLVYRLSVEDGSIEKGWPVNVASLLAKSGEKFQAQFQNQRGALAVVGGTVFVPYGGHFGDCGDYHGWVVGIPLANSSQARSWRTSARAGGIWAPGGISSDGRSIYFATGNTDGADRWSGGEAIIRLGPDLKFSGSDKDFFAPRNWKELDASDADLGGVAPVVVDAPGATPSKLAIGFGKDGNAYLLDRSHLGGIGGALAAVPVANRVISAPAAYTTEKGTYVVFKGRGKNCPAGQSGDLTAVRINPTSPPTLSIAWCADQRGAGSPIVTTTNGHSNAIVWGIGAEGDDRLRGFDGDTGKVVSDSGDQAMPRAQRYSGPIVAGGKIYIAGSGEVDAFSMR